MKRYISGIVAAILLLAVIPAFGGALQVSGEVTGVWPAGDIVTVVGSVWVPVNGTLTIEQGVVIHFNVTDPFVILGDFSALGTYELPIKIVAPNGWQGFHFRDRTNNFRFLRYVSMDETSGLPDTVVYSENAALSIQHCEFRGAKRCLAVNGGWLRADSNYFETTNALSIAVYLDNLEDEVIDGCGDEGNSLQDNVIRVDVPDFPLGDPILDRQTVGLQIQRFFHICLMNNVIAVNAPRDVDAIQFRETPDHGSGFWDLNHCVATSQSVAGQARGVVNKTEGQLWIRQCTIDVSRADINENLYSPMGVYVEGHATTLVTTTSVQVDAGEFFYNNSSEGRIDVDYVLEWQSKVQVAAQPPDDPELSLQMNRHLNNLMDSGPINYGDSIKYEDPQFLLNGEWGEWRYLSDASDYYGLRASSPCIDAGETARCGLDPDNTTPDIGCFYYDHSIDAVDPDYRPLPKLIEFATPYPNPFNSSTVIPLQIDHSGLLKVNVYNLVGQKVATLAEGTVNAGTINLLFQPDHLSAGLYYVTASFNGNPIATKTIVYLK